MYRAYTFRLDGSDFPIARYTRDHPDVRVIIYNTGRDHDSQLPVDNIYLVRAAKRHHEEVRRYIHESLEVRREITTSEPDALLFDATFKPPETGRSRGFMSVLIGSVGTVLSFRPMVVEDGQLEVSILVLPRPDTQVRIKALANFAREEKIGFVITRDDPVPYLPVRWPRMGHLDLLEAQVIQAIAGAGAYELEGPAVDQVVRRAAADIEEALGITDDEFHLIRSRSEKKILREFAEKLRRNLQLSTPKTVEEDEP